MGTTAGGLRYPEGSDPANVPLVVQNLAEDVDTFKAPKANPTFTGVAQFPDGSASAPSITNTGDTNTGLFHPAEDTVAISTGGSERVRVNSVGVAIVGHTSSVQTTLSTNALTPGLQRLGTSDDSAILTARYSAGVAGGALYLAHSRNTTTGSHTVLNSGDMMGRISAAGSDGTAFQEGARIEFAVDGTPGASDMPGRIGLYTTADGSATPTERMRIDSNGLITGTGTSLGAWTPYTPTLGGTGWAIGNGVIEGQYCQIGKVVHFRAYVKLGSTSTAGGSIGTITAPVTASSRTTTMAFITDYFDASTSTLYTGVARADNNSTTIRLRSIASATGQVAAITTTVPFTWAVDDEIHIRGTYEIA